MISDYISDIILSVIDDNNKVIDIGGARYPWFRANYILDRRKYEEKIEPTAFGGRFNEKERFDKSTWITQDFYDIPWPFEDKFFDFSLCMGTLEDLRDPISICKEIKRISKAGYISTPTRAVESAFGISPHHLTNKIVGYNHHRWFVEIIEGKLVFKLKHDLLYQHKEFAIDKYIQNTLNFFWDNDFECYEQNLGSNDDTYNEMKEFYYSHIDWLNNLETGNFDKAQKYNYWPPSWGLSPELFCCNQSLSLLNENIEKKNNKILVSVQKAVNKFYSLKDAIGKL